MATKESFEVDSALLSEIGEKLVTTPHVALAELVKNAFDADATEVHVLIRADEQLGLTVEISDDGHGMTRGEVHRYWMRIGTTNKIDEEYSPKYGRRRAGAKGIGRFACRRLGRVLHLTTSAALPKSKKSQTEQLYEQTNLHFDWGRFVPGTNVSSIDVEAETSVLRNGPTGLSLVISGAPEDEWSYRGYYYLKRQLSVLCANAGTKRQGYMEDPGFKVYLSAPGLEEEGQAEDLREQLMNAGWGTLTAHIDDRGRASCRLVAKGLGTRRITSGEIFPLLKDVKLNLAIFPFEREWLRDTHVVSQSSVREICQDWGGVQVRFRGFRVYPYGEGEDDWLGIDRDRARRLGKPTEAELFDFAQTLDGISGTRSLLNMLSMKSYLGAVEIGGNQEGLLPKADRMGFVEGEHFRQVKQFVRFATDWAMILRDLAVQMKETSYREELRKRLVEDHGISPDIDSSPEEAVQTLRFAVERIAEAVPPRKQKDLDLLEDAVSFVESSVKIANRDLLRLRLVASASTLTLLFAHEIRSLTGTFASIGRELSNVAESVPADVGKKLKTLSTEVIESEQSLSDLLELTDAMGVLNKDAKPVRLDLLDTINRATSRFERLIRRYDVDVDVSGVEEGILVGPMLEGELLAIIINVLSNSLKSVVAVGGKRIIAFRAQCVGKTTHLDVCDTGIGLPEEQFDEVFTPMISDPSGNLYDKLGERLNPEDKLLLGSGTGLGLSIVRGILHARRGDAELLSPSRGWSFQLRLRLP